MNQKGNLAWELYLRLDASVESFNLLHFIANDCYSVRALCTSNQTLF